VRFIHPFFEPKRTKRREKKPFPIHFGRCTLTSYISRLDRVEKKGVEEERGKKKKKKKGGRDSGSSMIRAGPSILPLSERKACDH